MNRYNSDSYHLSLCLLVFISFTGWSTIPYLSIPEVQKHRKTNISDIKWRSRKACSKSWYQYSSVITDKSHRRKMCYKSASSYTQCFFIQVSNTINLNTEHMDILLSLLPCVCRWFNYQHRMLLRIKANKAKNFSSCISMPYKGNPSI